LDFAGTVFKFDEAVFEAKFVDHFGDLDIVAAILGDFHHRFWVAGAFVFLPPFESIESICGFASAE
jgi:hypothetical protein